MDQKQTPHGERQPNTKAQQTTQHQHKHKDSVFIQMPVETIANSSVELVKKLGPEYLKAAEQSELEVAKLNLTLKVTQVLGQKTNLNFSGTMPEPNYDAMRPNEQGMEGVVHEQLSVEELALLSRSIQTSTDPTQQNTGIYSEIRTEGVLPSNISHGQRHILTNSYSAAQLSASATLTQNNFPERGKGEILIHTPAQFSTHINPHNNGKLLHYHNDPKAKKHDAGITSKVSFSNHAMLPGFGVYHAQKQLVLFDATALKLLNLSTEYKGQFIDPRIILRRIGPHNSRIVMRNLRGLQDVPPCYIRKDCKPESCPCNYTKEQQKAVNCVFLRKAIFQRPNLEQDNAQYIANHNILLSNLAEFNRTTFTVLLSRENGMSDPVYVKFSAFFNKEQKLNILNISLSKVASTDFECLPHLITESASFDWLIPSDECIFGRNYYNMLGYPQNYIRYSFRYSNWVKAIVHPEDLHTFSKEHKILEDDSAGSSFELLYRSRCADGSYLWTRCVALVVARDENKRATRIMGINIDVNHMIDRYEMLKNKVLTDILTGLKNRTYLITHLDEYIYQAHEPLSLIFTDVTALKMYNDYLGHTVGDKLLCSATLILKNHINRINNLIRISGDEILCILPACSASDVALLHRRLMKAMREYNIDAPVRMPVFFSMGMSTIDLSAYAGRNLSEKEKEQAQTLFYKGVQQADLQMQQNKRYSRTEHYSLVKSYIEKSLKRKIDLHDNRIFDSVIKTE